MIDRTQCRYLLFTLHGRLYALDLVQVAEVIDLPALWPIPGISGPYCGAMNFHGNIVAVLDLSRLLGLPPCTNPDKVIVLDPLIAALAFQVERVIRVTLAEQNVVATETSGEMFVQATLAVPEGEAVLLDAVAITEHTTAQINREEIS